MFEFWAGAKDNAEKLTLEEMYILDDYFSEQYPEGVSETEVNDWFWFYFDDILDILGKWVSVHSKHIDFLLIFIKV